MAAKYAKIDRVSSLEVGFQQVAFVQNFLNFHDAIMENQKFIRAVSRQHSSPGIGEIL